MIFLRSLLIGVVGFAIVAILAIAESYVSCLVRGVTYSLSLALPIAGKGGAVVGVALAVLTFIGSPKPRTKH